MKHSEFRELIDEPALRAQVSAEEMVSAALARISEVDSTVNAFISVRPDEALEEARQIDRARRSGEPVGPLAGLPIAVKDNIDVAGTRATAGSKILADRVPGTDAEAVRCARTAGAVVVGKTALHEFAYGVTTVNPHYGPCRNPWDPSRIPGGSSGGSGAALGADACVLALGTDTGGSVRIPAGLNGVTALRPTFGAVSVRGTLPVSASLDTVGPMARSALDVAALFRTIAGHDRSDPLSADGKMIDPLCRTGAQLDGIRIGVLSDFLDDSVEPEVRRAVHRGASVLSDLGAVLAEIEMPDAARAGEQANRLIRAETLSVHLEDLDSTPELFGEDVRRRLELGREISGVDVARGVAAMRAWRVEMLNQFDHFDLILTPTTSEGAPEIAGAEMIETTARLTRFTYPWSLAGLPAASVPCGFDAAGMPVGMQLVAAPWRDGLLLTAAAAFQRRTDWHRLRPDPEPKPATRQQA